jgi:hypothetical protein
MKKPTSVAVSINLPFGLGGLQGTWEPDESEQTAAWEMYVELVTRVAVVGLGPDEGLLREALSSLYSLFGTTRSILRAHGPEVAQANGNGNYSFGLLAVVILNDVLRPVLAKWHPILLEYESTRPPSRSQTEHENEWAQGCELRSALGEVRSTLAQYSELLASVAGVPSLRTHDGPTAPRVRR